MVKSLTTSPLQLRFRHSWPTDMSDQLCDWLESIVWSTILLLEVFLSRRDLYRFRICSLTGYRKVVLSKPWRPFVVLGWDLAFGGTEDSSNLIWESGMKRTGEEGWEGRSSVHHYFSAYYYRWIEIIGNVTKDWICRHGRMVWYWVELLFFFKHLSIFLMGRHPVWIKILLKWYKVPVSRNIHNLSKVPPFLQ